MSQNLWDGPRIVVFDWNSRKLLVPDVAPIDTNCEGLVVPGSLLFEPICGRVMHFQVHTIITMLCPAWSHMYGHASGKGDKSHYGGI